MKLKETFWFRIWLLISSSITFIISIIIFIIFSLPHASWMPTVPDWQEVAPKILSQLHEDIDWSDDLDKENFLLLISVTNFLGSMGYDRSTFFTEVSPNWTVFLTFTSIYLLLLAMASMAMICYLTYNYELSHRFIPIPWIILKFLLVFFLTIGLITLLGDMNSTSRLTLEQIQGTKGNYGMVVTSLMTFILILWFNIMVAYLHVEHMMMEKEKQNRLDEMMLDLVEVSNEQQQQRSTTHEHRVLSPRPPYSSLQYRVV